jgi:methionyl aminopeptidase
MFTKVKTPAEIEAMREAGKMLATVLNYLKPKVVAGVSTKELADIAAAKLKDLGGEPAFLGYYGFPHVLCVSVNDEVVHGIPREDHIIREGDIVGLDFGVKIRGMITDAAISVIAGKGSLEDRKLVETTQASLIKGIKAIKPGRHIGAISSAVQSVLEPAGYGIVRDFVGHGVGHELHEEPNIPNYGSSEDGPVLVEGMTIAIEPMTTIGNERVYIASDQWTVKTLDSSRSAHFEHTVLVTKDGAEILTTI